MRFIYVGLDTKHGARTKHEPAELAAFMRRKNAGTRYLGSRKKSDHFLYFFL